MSQYEIELILMRQLASYLAMPIFIVDEKGALLFFNEPAEQLLGSRFDEVGELSMEEWFATFSPRGEDGTPLPYGADPLGIAVRLHEPAHRTLGFTGFDGVARTIATTAFPLEGQGGRHLGAVAIFWGVDERPSAEGATGAPR